MTKPKSTIELLRQLLGSSDKTRYRIARETGISEAMLCRIVKGERGCKTDIADTLLAYFGYEIRKKGRAK